MEPNQQLYTSMFSPFSSTDEDEYLCQVSRLPEGNQCSFDSAKLKYNSAISIVMNERRRCVPHPHQNTVDFIASCSMLHINTDNDFGFVESENIEFVKLLKSWINKHGENILGIFKRKTYPDKLMNEIGTGYINRPKISEVWYTNKGKPIDIRYEILGLYPSEILYLIRYGGLGDINERNYLNFVPEDISCREFVCDGKLKIFKEKLV